MLRGTIVEQGDSDEIFNRPQHEYTRATAGRCATTGFSPWLNKYWRSRSRSSCWPAARRAPTIVPSGPATTVGATSDINPQNPAILRDGGDLRLPLTEFPSNFNTLHIDGNSADVASMLKATMPRAFVIGPDGSTTVDTDYFSSVELTGTNPQVVTYTINPKADLDRRQPAQLGGHRQPNPRHQWGRQELRDRRHQRQRTSQVGDPRSQ